MEIANLIKKHRKQVGIKQKEVSAQLGYTSAQFVSNWERGISWPPLKDVNKVCAILKIKPAKLKSLMIKARREEIERAFNGNT